MSHRSDKRILIVPEEMNIDSPEMGKMYIELLRLTNTLSTPVDLLFKLPNMPDRLYEIVPQSLRIPSGEEAKVEIRFKVSKPIPKIKAVRDTVLIKSEYFEQQFFINYKSGGREVGTPKEKRRNEDFEKENKELKIALEQKSEDLAQAEGKITSLEGEIDALKQEIEGKREEIEEIVHVKETNLELNERLEDAEELRNYFDQVKAMLNERMPNFDELMDLSLRQERQKHQRMSEKALEVLKAKDREITELKGRMEEQQQGIVQLQQKLTDSRVLISNTEKSLKQANKAIEELKMSLYERDRQVQAVEAELESLRSLANRSETDAFEKQELEVHTKSQIDDMQSAIKTLESDLNSKTAAFDSMKASLIKAELEVKRLSEREQYVLELSARQTKVQQEHEKTLRDKEQVIGELKSKVSTQTEHIQSLLSQFSQQRDSDVVGRVLKLEEENRALQMQLAESQRSSHQPSSRSMKEEDLRPSASNKQVQSLEEENEKLSKSIRDAQMKFSKDREELEASLAGKNRELLDLQQKLLQLQARLSDVQTPPDRLARTFTPEQSAAISEENAKLRQSLQVLEQQNAELTGEIELLAKKTDMEHPADSIVTQTQLVSRLNARVSTMKSREEKALRALEMAEAALKQKEALLINERSQWEQERNSLLSSSKSPTKSEAANAVVQTDRDTAWAPPLRSDPDNMDQVWTNAMVARYERRLAELDKDATGYQMKHYAALKETHDLKEKLARRISEDMENQIRWERDRVQLQVKYENLREQFDSVTGKHNAQMQELAQERGKITVLETKLESINQESHRTAAAQEDEVRKLANQRDSLQSELKERTAQISILMDTLVALQDRESSDAIAKKCTDLAVQLSNEQAVISNQEQRISELKSILQAKQREILDLEREKSSSFLKSAESEAKAVKLTQAYDALNKQMLEMRQEAVAQVHDIQNLQVQTKRLQDELSDAKAKLSVAADQLTESERRHSQVIATERREFKEALLTAKDQPLQVFDVSQPVVLALKQLTVALNAISDKAPSQDLFLQLVKEMGDLVLNCDKALIMAEAKLRRLEFVAQSEVHFKYLDPATLEMTYSMLDRQEMLANELKKLKKPQQTNMQDVYRRRVDELESMLKSRTESLRVSELEKSQNQYLVASLKDRIQSIQAQFQTLQADKDAFEVLSIARAEEELKGKNRLRDEGVKTYIDGVITRAALNSSEASKLLNLSREIAGLKLVNDELVSALGSRTKERDLLYLSNESLKEILADLEGKQETEFVPGNNGDAELRTKCDQQTSTAFEMRKEAENMKEQIEELKQLLADTKTEAKRGEEPPVRNSLKEEELQSELLELKERHRLEMDSLRTDCNLKMQQFKKELETEYSHALEEFKDGTFPGEYKRRCEDLERRLQDLSGEHAAMEDMLVQAQSSNSILSQGNQQLKEELDLARQILADLQSPLQRTSETPPSPRRASTSSKKPSKKLSLDRSSGPMPQKLVQALVAAKIGEAEGAKKLRTAGKMHVELRENLLKKDSRIKELEAKMKTLEAVMRRKGIDIGNAGVEDRENEPIVTLKSHISELEQENAELRLAEASGWAAYTPLLYGSQSDLGLSETPRDDFALLVEGIVYLTQHLDQDSSPVPPTIEQSQRLVIRALGHTISRLKNEPVSELIEYRPSKAEDRQVWYLELVETQLNEVHDTIRKLVEFTNKVAVEVTGSFTGNAQYKGASMELAKCTKETAEELEAMRQLCILVRQDLQTLRPQSSQDDDDLVYRDRATLAENMKRRLEDEIVSLKMEHSYAISQMENQLSDMHDDRKRAQTQVEVVENERKKVVSQYEETKARSMELEIALEKERESASQLKAQIADLASVKQDAGKQVDRFQRELRQWQQEHAENLRAKESLISELQKQVKSLMEERQKTTESTGKLKGKTVKRGGEVDDEEALDIKRRISILTEERKLDETQYQKDKQNYETRLNQQDSVLRELRNQLQNKDSELEAAKSKLDKATKAANRPPRQKDVSKQADLELEIHSQAIEIMNMKNEHESELMRLQTLLSDVQKQLRDKVESADSEVRKRLESESKLKDVSEERKTMENRLKSIAETAAEEARNWHEEVNRVETELRKLRTEKEDLTRTLQAKSVGADNLAQLILQTEKERKATEGEIRIERDRLLESLSIEKGLKSALEQELKEMKSVLETLKSDLRDAQQQGTEALEQVSRKEKSILSLKQELGSLIDREKSWEVSIEEIRLEKTDLEAKLNAQIQELKTEMGRQFEVYSKNIEMYEGQLAALKDICTQDQRAKKGVKKAAETVDFFVQLSKKEAVINSLKSELRETKKKPQKRVQEEEGAHIYRLKAKLHTLKAQLTQEKDSVSRLREDLAKAESQHEENKEKDANTRKDLGEIERKYKAETQRLAEEVTRIREKWHSPEEWLNLSSTLKDLESQHRRTLEELKRKSELLETFKTAREQHDSEASALQDELENIKDISEQVKKLKSEVQRKDRALQDTKTALDSLRETDKRMGEETAVLTERLRVASADVKRKENIIKDLKTKLDAVSADAETNKNVSEQCERLKEQVKRLKQDIERKEATAKLMKTKLESAELETETTKAKMQKISTEAFATVQSEVSKNEGLEANLNRSEAQLQALYMITRRIFRELVKSVESLKQRVESTVGFDREAYSDCMNILRLSEDELKEFMEPAGGSTNTAGILEQIDSLLEEKTVKVNEVIELFEKLLEERAHLERSSGDVASKYQDYIRRMQQDVSQEREAYEQKIKDLESSLRRQRR